MSESVETLIRVMFTIPPFDDIMPIRAALRLRRAVDALTEVIDFTDNDNFVSPIYGHPVDEWIAENVSDYDDMFTDSGDVTTNIADIEGTHPVGILITVDGDVPQDLTHKVIFDRIKAVFSKLPGMTPPSSVTFVRTVTTLTATATTITDTP